MIKTKFSLATSRSRDHDDQIRASFATRSLHDLLSEEEIRQVQQWTDEWLILAVKEGVLKWPCAIDEATIRDIQKCYRMKMTPEEAVHFFNRMGDEGTLF
ncbi:hypothetical protein AB4Y32_36075 [Paraburkholderia phymatum]|uniref:Uncharacterized protein n=1 Tax=Paraburkholderia phymatum TaxID=148447 RepID=A0ACC6UC88_9BURK